MQKRGFIFAITSLVFVIVGIVFVGLPGASAASDEQPCVPAAAWTETIEHPAITHEVTVPGTPDLWWNWSPNKQQEPFEGPPDFPVDARGTWQGPHENGGPEQGTYGTFNTSNGENGRASWFHREKGTPETTITVVDKEAWTETIEHPAVVCETTPPTPTQTPEVTPSVTPEPTPTEPEGPLVICGIEIPQAVPGQPVPRDILCPIPGDEDEPRKKDRNNPESPKAPVQLTECVDGVFVTTRDGKIISKAGSCDDVTTQASIPTIAREEGL